MTPLATLEQFAEYRQVTFDPSDVFALRQLESASALIRASLGQVVNLVEDDVITIDGLGRRGLVLPQIPVVEVTEVRLLTPGSADEVLTDADFTVDASGILWRSASATWGWGWGWPRMRGNVQVTYTHGYETMPDEAVTLCCMVASRLLELASSGGQVVTKRAQTIGGASLEEDFATGGATTTVRGLTVEEDAFLRAYPWPMLVEAEAS